MKLNIPLLSLLDDTLLGESSVARSFGAASVGKRGAVPALASIVVRGRNGANLIESRNAEEHDGTFFGRVKIGDWAGLSRTFSIHNAGTAPLKLGCTGLEGTGADQFEITQLPEPVVAPGGSTALTIRYRGTAGGKCSRARSHPEQQPYLFLIEARLPTRDPAWRGREVGPGRQHLRRGARSSSCQTTTRTRCRRPPPLRPPLSPHPSRRSA